MKRVLVSENISKACCDALVELGYKVIKLPPFDRLQKGVSSHADMLCFYRDGCLVTHRDYYSKNRELFDGLGVRLVLSDEKIKAEYPYDVLFNAVLTNDGVLFSKTVSTSKYIKEISLECVEVKQGYTSCSTCRVDDRAFITSDIGLYKSYSEKGIDCLLISAGSITLPEYDTGFIGGSSVVLSDKVCFFGKVENHPDYKKIKEFIEKTNKTLVSLSDEKLTDIGGGIVLL